MKTLEITKGQVRQIAEIAKAQFEVVNHTTYYNIVDKQTRQSSLEGGKHNLVSYRFGDLVRHWVLKLSGKTQNDLMWDCVGVNVANANQNYIFKVKEAVVKLF